MSSVVVIGFPGASFAHDSVCRTTSRPLFYTRRAWAASITTMRSGRKGENAKQQGTSQMISEVEAFWAQRGAFQETLPFFPSLLAMPFGTLRGHTVPEWNRLIVERSRCGARVDAVCFYRA